MKHLLSSIAVFIFSVTTLSAQEKPDTRTPVDFVNPYIGNISHLLVPTYPTIHLPNSMLRVYPERENFTGNEIKGLPVMITSHRGSSAFNLSAFQGDKAAIKPVISYGYDNEVIKPYYYETILDDYNIAVKYAPSHQSAIYSIDFLMPEAPSYLIMNSGNGQLQVKGNTVSGYQNLDNNTKVYVYMETDVAPTETGVLSAGKINSAVKSAQGKDACVVLSYPARTKQVKVRYGISFISTAQAQANLKREIKDYDVLAVAEKGRQIWNTTLGKIKVEGTNDTDKIVFYTSLYRTYERMISISEDGNYYSAFDSKVHKDNGVPFYTDDWIWDTFRATHPLRIIIEPEKEGYMINSYLRMAEQMDNHWMPTFPEVTGDSRRMNSNHGVATVADAYAKGLRSFDLQKAYDYCKAGITEKTLAPWSGKKAGTLNAFYKNEGYFPALAVGETETVPEVHSWEKRQPVAVTLGTVYDEWCLGKIAGYLGKKEDEKYFLNRSLNYRKIFNPVTKFFHPKDAAGKFIKPFDYRYSSGIGAREAYDENNGYVYRWDVIHNVADLVKLIGGSQAFVDGMEDMYNTPLGKGRPDFYHQFGDHTGNVGQFSMGNEPSMHIPYLYNYAGQPWRTQKRIRSLIKQWFRNDLMGIPGDEDGGGLTSFVVFSHLGFYPITPGLPMYTIGSPYFSKATITLSNGKTFTVVCKNYAPDNKYIQSATLNGAPLNKSWFGHDDLMKGGTLEFVMDKYPNKNWAADAKALPPSFVMPQ
jgi:predicted alpha-1,2-mannosidase